MGCRKFGENGFQFSTMVPVAPLKIVIELFAALAPVLPVDELSEQAVRDKATAATVATARTLFICGSLDRSPSVRRRMRRVDGAHY